MSRHVKPGQNGFLLVSLLMATLFIVAAALVTFQLAISNIRAATVEYDRLNAQLAADAGLDHAISSMNVDPNTPWLGSGGEIELLSNSVVRTTFETTVTPHATDPFINYLTVIARAYDPSPSTTVNAERRYELELRGVGGSSYSIVTGVGGLYMSNNSKIVGGNVYVNGEIHLSNSAQIGLTSNLVDVKAAHSNCPAAGGATYPTVCAPNENGEPITIDGSAKIYGEVQGTNQTNGASMFSPGLVAGSPPPQPLPSHDRDAQKAAVATEITGASAGCNNGTKTWDSNTKITGDVEVRGTCKVTVTGDVWITGNLVMQNSAEVIVANGQADPPVIMIDGPNGLDASQSAVFRSSTDATPLGFRVITQWSTASCSPDCVDVTGTDLYNTRNSVTIRLDNSASGPQTEFYARWSRVNIVNSGNIGALVGQTIELSNSGTITFGTSVTGVGGISAWAVNSYKRTY